MVLARPAATMALQMEALREMLREVVATTVAATLQGRGGGGQGQAVPSEGKRRQRTLVEKDFRRVDKFDGVEKNWKTFEFDFRIAAKAVSPKVVEAMDQVALTDQVVTGASFEAADGVSYEGMQERGLELFEILCGLTSGSAKIMIREAPDNDGFAAWQILSRTYGRRTLANSLRKYREAVNPKQAKEMNDIVGMIAKWENAVKELERTEQEKVPNMIKMAALTEICTGDIRDMIYQNVDTTKTYEAMKEKVVSWVSNRVASGVLSVPMDVDGLGWSEEDEWNEWSVDAVTAGTMLQVRRKRTYGEPVPDEQRKRKGPGEGQGQRERKR